MTQLPVLDSSLHAPVFHTRGVAGKIGLHAHFYCAWMTTSVAFANIFFSGQAGIDTILGYRRQSSAREQESRTQGTLQRTAYNMICQRDNYDAEERVRNKQKRWYLSSRERHPHIQLNVRNSTPAWQAQRTHYTTCSYSTRLWRLACSLQRSVLSSIVGALRADTNSAAPT
jgi:hypothetical protein